MSNWREETEPWKNVDRKIYNTMKVREKDSKATVLILCNPREVQTGYGQSFTFDLGYLGGNAIKQLYDPDNKKGPKPEVPVEVGDICSMWLTKTFIQSLVNLFPDENEEMVGKVVDISRNRVTGGRQGSYLAYRVEFAEEFNPALVKSLKEKYQTDFEDIEITGTTEDVGDQYLEVAYQLVKDSLQTLEEMTFKQIDNFIAKRKSMDLIKSDITAEQVANYCVSKEPDVFKIVVDGDKKTLVLE